MCCLAFLLVVADVTEDEEEDNIDELLHVEERSAPSLLSIEEVTTSQ